MKLFTPSSEKLTFMIKAAEAKFEAAREQAALRKEAADDSRMERFLIAEAKSKHAREAWF